MYAAASLSIVFLSLVLVFARASRSHPLPPGPRPLPFIGHLRYMSRPRSFLTFRQLGRVYGPVIAMHVFGRRFVILNNLQSILDLFERKSSIYNSRPHAVMVGELVGREKYALLFNKYGNHWKKTRKLVHGWIGQRASSDSWAQQALGSFKLLRALIESPDQFADHARTYTGSVIMKLTYGIDCLPVGDPYIATAEQLSAITATAVQPGRWMVDSFPSLKYIPSWLPGAGFKRWASRSRQICNTLVRVPYEKVIEDMRLGQALPSSWTANELMADNGIDVDVLLCATSSMYIGAIDPVVAFFRTFILCMLLHPDVQQRAQEEVDHIVGIDRLATMDEDYVPHRMKYVESVIKEILRFNPPAPLVTHSLHQDDVYNEMLIPQGSWVMANLWAVLHDPEIYKNPEDFKPDRFFQESPEKDLTPYVWGFGRRYCPGYHFVQAHLFLYVTHVLSVFNISPIENEPLPRFEFEGSLISMPKPFRCHITPRGSEKVALVYQILAEA